MTAPLTPEDVAFIRADTVRPREVRLCDTITAAWAENARLREALQRIADRECVGPATDEMMPCGMGWKCESCVAATALAPTPGKEGA